MFSKIKVMGRVGAIAIVGVALLGSPAAFAASTGVSGTVSSDSDELFLTGTIAKTTKDGNIDLSYTNGIGAGGCSPLYIRLTKTDGTPFADTRTFGCTGGTQTIGTNVKKGTSFRIQYRNANGVTANHYWAGTVYYH